MRHIAHVPTVRRIIEDQKIEAGLVYDEEAWREAVLLAAEAAVHASNAGVVHEGNKAFSFDPLADLAEGRWTVAPSPAIKLSRS